jgi:hypothetical protein
MHQQLLAYKIEEKLNLGVRGEGEVWILLLYTVSISLFSVPLVLGAQARTHRRKFLPHWRLTNYSRPICLLKREVHSAWCMIFQIWMVYYFLRPRIQTFGHLIFLSDISLNLNVSRWWDTERTQDLLHNFTAHCDSSCQTYMAVMRVSRWLPKHYSSSAIYTFIDELIWMCLCVCVFVEQTCEVGHVSLYNETRSRWVSVRPLFVKDESKLNICLV